MVLNIVRIYERKEASLWQKQSTVPAAWGLQLLELLSEHPEGMELHEICKALELPKSSGHNLLQQLVQSRYVWVSSHGKYRLTLKTFEVGASAVHATEISQVLRQYMQEVFAVCNETMALWRSERTRSALY